MIRHDASARDCSFLCVELDDQGVVLMGCGGGFQSSRLTVSHLIGKNLGEALGLGGEFDLCEENALAGESASCAFSSPEDIVVTFRPRKDSSNLSVLILPNASVAPTGRLARDFDLLPDRIYLLDGEGTYLDVRGGAGEDPAAWHGVLGMKVEDVLPPEIADLFKRNIHEALQTEEEQSASYELILDTGLHHFEARFLPFNRETVLAIVRNISDQVYAEEALKFSEKRYRGVVEDQTELICRAEPNGMLTFVNDAFVRYFGRPRMKLIGRMFTPTASEDDPAELDAAFATLGYDQPVVTVVRRATAGDGSQRWQQWTHRLLFNEDGQMREIQCIGHDITDRRLAEEALAQTELKFQRMAALIDQAFWIYDESTSRFVYTGPAFSRILGVQPVAVPVKLSDFLEYVVPESQDALKRAFAQRFERESTIEFQIVRAEGSVRWLRVRGFLLEERDGGKTICGVADDITPAKQTERQLRKSEERLHLALDSTEDGLFDWDLRTARLFVAKRWAEMLGFAESDIRPHFDAWKELMHPDDAPDVLRELDEHIAGDSPAFECEYRMRTKSGDWLWVLTRGKVTDRERDRPIRMVGTNVDISDRREAQDAMHRAVLSAERAARTKSDFLATMSHEIRTPLNGVIGMLGLLQDTSLDTNQAEYTETARVSSDTLLGIINDILDFSKIEADRMELEIIATDLRQCVEEAVELCAGELANKQLETTVVFDPRVPPRMMADPGRLRQILLNLVSNAVKFTEAGEIVVRVELVECSGDLCRVNFSVTDSGIGISPTAREKLFQPFTQIDASTTRQFGGTGLGLAISRRLVELMSGEIGHRDAPSGGSEFWFRLPLVAAERERRFAPMPRAQVLVVGSREAAVAALQSDLLSFGCKVTACTTQEEAEAALAKRTRYRVVIIDTAGDRELPRKVIGIMRHETRRLNTPIHLLVRLNAGTDTEISKADLVFRTSKPLRLATLHQIVDNPLESRGAMDRDATVYESNGSQPRARVLVVEDNPVNQKVARLLLQKGGYRSDVVANGSEALDALAQVAYDMVLMDCMMPVMDGYEATREIRRREAGHGRIPIIAMTAFALEGDRQKCLDAGMDDYLKKPIQLEELASMLDKHCPENHHPALDDTGEILDLEILRRTTGTDKAFLRELLSMIHDDLTNRIPMLDRALDEGNARAIRREAHTIKGHALHTGSAKLGNIMLEIEKSADRGDINACRLRSAPAKSLAARLIRELKKHV